VLVGKRQNVGYRFLGFLSRVGTTDRLPLPVGAKHSGRRLTILNLRSCHVGLGCLRGGSQHAPNESPAPLSGRGFLLFGLLVLSLLIFFCRALHVATVGDAFPEKL
jgi:hypothetical protein